jgi:hypothetical protein
MPTLIVDTMASNSLSCVTCISLTREGLPVELGTMGPRGLNPSCLGSVAYLPAFRAAARAGMLAF